MQTLYLLLRQNQQTGPYRLNELVNLNLSPYDLVWIEGQSAGWYYPQEIEALRPHLSFLKPAAPKSEAPFAKPSVEETASPAKKIFVSMPGTHAKVEAPTAPSQAPLYNERKWVEENPWPTASLSKPPVAETLQQNLAEEKQKPKPRKNLPPKRASVALCLLGTAALAAWWMLRSTDAPQTEMNLNTPTAVAPPQSAELPASEPAATPTSAAKKKTDAGIKPVARANRKAASATAVVQTKHETLPAQKPAAVEKEPSLPPEDVVKTAPAETAKQPAEAPKEKRRLRDRIAELFGKKPAEKTEEAKPAEEEGGRRQSTRREAGSSLTQMVGVRFDVPNDWMMGISGAKAILTNRSSETLAKATVQVLYYNDENEVLDKRIITFNNVKSKSSQTVTIPDHKTATRLEYVVLSAVGAGEPVARR